MQAAVGVSDSTTPYVFGQVASLAQCTEEFVSTTSLCWDNRRLRPIVQGHVDDVGGEHSPILETNASDIAPLKSLIPLGLEVRKNTDPNLGRIELHGEDFAQRL